MLGLLGARTRTALLDLGNSVTYGPRQIVIRQGEPSHHVVIPLAGALKVVVDTEFGRPVLLALRGPGDILGEMSVFEGRSRSANVQTCTPVQARLVGKARFNEFLDRHPDVWRAVASSLSTRLHWANSRRAEILSCPAPLRVGRVLADIVQRHGHRAGEGWILDLSLTQAELASLSGVALSTFEKTTQRLHRWGVLRSEYRRIVVDDLAALLRFGRLAEQNPYLYGVDDPDVAQS
ncbi:Crp/Fnr family transcriptional regulator [Amycolatopsis sp. MtRt-6]|uniref:Crp/Fnr family transcriptional regulator n=1 Tax=Amycolatopsis sp. MtRt-6 TaxID=2792782 RepID=UPI001A8DC35E|nr:Crp/Fnr family transcriptional regulator [Amycolatopsis sp. MtRt-6]